MSLGALRTLTVDAFGLGSPRVGIFDQFCDLVFDLEKRGFRCELLCNGSFVTESLDPSDIDVVVRVDFDFVAAMDDDQTAFFDSLNDDLADHVVDTFAEVAFPIGHPDFGAEEGPSWEAHYGLEHGGVWLKGIAVVKVGETDVGLRLRR